MAFISYKLRLLIAFSITLGLSGCNATQTASDRAHVSTQATGSFIWHDLITHDIEAIRPFYQQLFGWEFEHSSPRQGNPYLLAKRGGRYAAGIVQMQRPSDGSSQARWLGYMSVDDLDTALDSVRNTGGTIVEEARMIGEMSSAAAIEDSQRAVVAIIETSIDAETYILREATGAIVWDELLAKDSQVAASFYTKLGHYQVTVINRRGGEYIVLESDNQKIAGILQNPLGDTDPLWLSYFAVSDPVETVAMVESLGGKVLLPPSDDLREGNMALIQDPEGTILAIQKWPL